MGGFLVSFLRERGRPRPHAVCTASAGEPPALPGKAAYILEKNQMRIGHGFDIHRFEDGKLLVLGGVQIPYPKGMKAHSDGDVLLHAVCDALLGAASLKDIGTHFPDTDPRYKGIDSRNLLR